MANTNILSYQITDGIGRTRSLPIYFPTGLTVAQIQGASDLFAAALDVCIDGKLTQATLQLNLTLPGGIKGSAGGDVRVGLLAGFDCANTVYRHSMYIPTWEAAGFTGDVITETSPYDDFIADILAGEVFGGGTLAPSDEYANDIVAFLEGKKKVRK